MHRARLKLYHNAGGEEKAKSNDQVPRNLVSNMAERRLTLPIVREMLMLMKWKTELSEWNQL
jgi:hypothetical protein